MKRILLACCMLVASCAASFAQSSHPVPTPVSKPDFIAKVGQLNTLITAGNMTAAEAKWNEIAALANLEVTVVAYKIEDAVAAHNDADKAHFEQLAAQQRSWFAEAMQMKANMPANKAVINARLSSFGDSII